MRATLLECQSGPTVCRDCLLDLFVAINRLRTPDGNGYIVDSVDDCNIVANSVNVRLLRPMDFKPKLEEENNIDSELAVEKETNSAVWENTADAPEVFLNLEKDVGKNLLDTAECDKGEAEVKKRNQSEDSEENMTSLQSALQSENIVENCVNNPEPLSPEVNISP